MTKQRQGWGSKRTAVVAIVALMGTFAAWRFVSAAQNSGITGVFGGDIPPIRVLQDGYSTFAGIAVDYVND
jgi:hypothetical protein